jgi:hypothetical protein
MNLPRWEISTNLGRRAAAGVDGRGWLWEIVRGEEVGRVMIEITAAAWSADPLRLPEDTRRALETDGRAELLKVLGEAYPPRVIRCSSTGCRYLSGGQLNPRGTSNQADGGMATDRASAGSSAAARG